MALVLVVDDDPGFTPAVAEVLERLGCEVEVARSLREARERLAEVHPDALLVDLLLPDGEGLELVAEVGREVRVIVITGHPSVERAVDSLRARVDDFLIKPLDLGRLKQAVGPLLEASEARRGTGAHRQRRTEEDAFGPLVGRSPAMQAVYEAIDKVAPTEATVFIIGESGTGKELAAQAIHERSARREHPFLAVNCGAVPAELIGSELFGHERGSFTGASRRHRGFFERARGGTLLLDEVTEMPLELQVNLLRVLEQGSFRRIGGDRDLESDARVVAATNRDPQAAVGGGRLREDLYFRLMVFPLELPPLRARAGDVELLARYFLDLLNEQQDSDKRLSPEALAVLERHHWPGNVRELRNVVQRAFILADVTIDAAAIEAAITPGQDLAGAGPRISVGTTVHDAERELILQTLDHYQGNKRAAAEALGISLKTLYNKLKEYGQQ